MKLFDRRFGKKKQTIEEDQSSSGSMPDEWFYAYPTSPIDMFRKELEEEMKESKE